MIGHFYGVLEVIMNERGHWSLVIGDPQRGGYVTVMRGDLAAGTREVVA